MKTNCVESLWSNYQDKLCWEFVEQLPRQTVLRVCGAIIKTNCVESLWRNYQDKLCWEFVAQLSRQTVLRVCGAIIISLPACKIDGDKRVCIEMGQKIQIPVPLQSHCWVRQVQPFNFNKLVWTFLILAHVCLHLQYTSACIYFTCTININLHVFAWMDQVGNTVPGLHSSMFLKCFCQFF